MQDARRKSGSKVRKSMKPIVKGKEIPQMEIKKDENRTEGLETLEGIVENIIYQNSENGYTVLDMSVEGDDLPKTVVGIIPQIAEGESIKVMGKWDLHSTYGKQLKVEYYERRQPIGKEAILRYLSARTIKGIGPKTAQRIVERFGDETLNVIESSPEFLADIDGISYAKAMEIGKIYKEQFGMRNVIIFASEFFGMATALKIYKKWGSSAVDIIKSNPYILCDGIDGVGFARADKVARSLGGAIDSPDRVRSGMKYILEFNAQNNGHTFIPKNKLLEAAANLLEVGENAVWNAYEELILNGQLKCVEHGRTECVYLREYYDAERYICSKLDLLAKTVPPLGEDNVARFIDGIEYETGIEYAPMQKKAIHEAVSSGVMILTGGPGTGKTTVIRAVIEIFRKVGLKVALAAPTGRAAKRMSEGAGQEAKTIHRMLEMEYPRGSSSPVYRKNRDNPIEENVIILDESSMIDTLLMSALLTAVKPGARIILIGDADQLPSIGAGNILNDLILSERFSTVRLKEIFRQARMSRIITNAHMINSGEYPILTDKSNDFFFIPRQSDTEIKDAVVSLYTVRLPKSYGEEIKEGIQVICPSRKGMVGTAMLNSELQKSINPPDGLKKEKKQGERVFREGDKVMQIKNNYDLEWEKGGREGSGIFNGDIGVIKSISHAEEKMTVDFEGRIVRYDFCMLEELEHAYAITIHKSQGSEYPVVIIPVFKNTPLLLTRELFYTAVTRAQKMVILVGQEEIVNMMVDNSRRPNRYTGIRFIMKEYME